MIVDDDHHKAEEGRAETLRDRSGPKSLPLIGNNP